MHNVNDLIRLVQDQLNQAKIDSAQAEAAMLVSHVLQVDRGKLGVMQALGETIDQNAVDRIRQLTDARATRVPLQHLTGETGFYGLNLKVEPGVFIPRVETEILVETTLDRVATGTGPLTILDLCTGSGAIAAALADQLAKRGIETHIWAVDQDPKAVALATHNTRKYNVTVLCADATDAQEMILADPALAGRLGSFDAVVSNPPYIPTDTPVTQAEADYDPPTALYGGSTDGMAIPVAIADRALQWLTPGGFFIMEHDHTHAAQLADALCQEPGWHQVDTIQDLTQTDRFVAALRTELAQPTPTTSPTLAQ